MAQSAAVCGPVEAKKAAARPASPRWGSVGGVTVGKSATWFLTSLWGERRAVLRICEADTRVGLTNVPFLTPKRCLSLGAPLSESRTGNCSRAVLAFTHDRYKRRQSR